MGATTIISVRGIEKKRCWERQGLFHLLKALAAVVAELADGIDFAAARPASPDLLKGWLLLPVLSLMALNETNELSGLRMIGVDSKDLTNRDQRLFALPFLIKRDCRGHEVSRLDLKLLNALELDQPFRGVLDE